MYTTVHKKGSYTWKETRKNMKNPVIISFIDQNVSSTLKLKRWNTKLINWKKKGLNEQKAISLVHLAVDLSYLL